MIPPTRNRSEFVALAVERTSLYCGDELYELFAYLDRTARERATGPDDDTVRGAVMGREHRAIAGRKSVRRRRRANVHAFDEVELPGRQRGEMSFRVEVGSKPGKWLARRRRGFVCPKSGAYDLWNKSEDEDGDDPDSQHAASF